MAKQGTKMNLYPYVFHYNPYTEYWNAVPRGKEVDYFNGKLSGNDVIKNRDINVIIEYIKTNG